MAEKTIARIRAAVRELLGARGVRVDRIVMFGSVAAGSNRRGSDVDLAVISRSFRNQRLEQRIAMVSGLHRELIRRFHCPFDILYYSDLEWRRGESFLQTVGRRQLPRAAGQ